VRLVPLSGGGAGAGSPPGSSGPAASPLLVVQDLSVRYGERRVLQDVELTVHGGSTLAVIGPNGSGKSTLLLAVAGLVPLHGGRVVRARSDTALVLQSTEIERTLPITVGEAVGMGRYPRLGLLRRFGPADHSAVAQAMARLGISDLAGRQLHDLSGGQRQRALVAQGLAQQADLLLLDEPVTGLDVVSQEQILRVIAEERASGRAVILTTHSLDEARRCDRVLLLAGRPIAYGPPSEVIQPAHLRDAFGTGAVHFDDGAVFLDDPHH
jgi:manganese transport system ATP-binding protein